MVAASSGLENTTVATGSAPVRATSYRNVLGVVDGMDRRQLSLSLNELEFRYLELSAVPLEGDADSPRPRIPLCVVRICQIGFRCDKYNEPAPACPETPFLGKDGIPVAEVAFDADHSARDHGGVRPDRSRTARPVIADPGADRVGVLGNAGQGQGSENRERPWLPDAIGVAGRRPQQGGAGVPVPVRLVHSDAEAAASRCHPCHGITVCLGQSQLTQGHLVNARRPEDRQGGLRAGSEPVA